MPKPTSDAQQNQLLATRLWEQCSNRLKADATSATWDGFLSQLVPLELIDERLVVAAPNQMIRDRVQRDHLDTIVAAMLAAGLIRPVLEVLVKVHPLHRQPQGALALDDSAQRATQPTLPHGGFAQPPRQTKQEPGVAATRHPASASVSSTAVSDATKAHASGLKATDTFETFVIGPSNRFPASAALAIAEEPGKKYNPLFIHSDSGLGKTHLLHAIGNYVCAHRPELRVLYVTSEEFLNDFINAIRHKTQYAFKQRYREIDVLLLDDIHFIEASDSTQDELFHTFNALHNRDAQIVIASDRSPREIPGLHDRVRTRFEWGLITDIQSPELETRIAILRMLSEGADVADEVLHCIAERVTHNVRELEGAYTRIQAYANLTGVAPTVELAETVLGSGEAHSTKRVSPQQIMERAAQHFDVSVEAIQGHVRTSDLVRARHVAMYVIREVTELSLASIAQRFGGRDHTTVRHACGKIANQMNEDSELLDTVQDLLSWARGAQAHGS